MVRTRVLVLFLFACAPPTPTPTPEDPPNANEVGPTGGLVSAAGVSLSVPAGALTEPTVITITELSEAAPAGITARSKVYKFEPEGLTFATPVTVKIAYQGVGTVALYWTTAADGSVFEVIDGTSSDGTTLTGRITHFSRGLAGDPPPVPPTVPDPPTNVYAEAGDAFANVYFTAPENDGGSEITQYTVTASPGGASVSTSELQATITGLQNGETYTFTVIATNAVGNSVPSEPSNEITPRAPIWVHRGPLGGGVWSVAGDPTDITTAFAVTERALYRTRDLGGAWEPLPPVETEDELVLPSYVTVAPDSGRVFFVMASETAAELYASDNSGDSFYRWDDGTFGDANPRQMLRLDDGTWLSCGYGGIARSSDDGQSWTSPTGQPNAVCWSITAHAAVVYAGFIGAGVYKSEDAGVGFVATAAATSDRASVALSADGETLYYAKWIDGVDVSTNGGEMFSPIAGAPNQNEGLLVDPRDGTLYLATAEGGPLGHLSVQVAATGDFLQRPTDGSFAVNALAFNSNDTMGALWVATRDGVRVTLDRGLSYSELGEGMTDVELFDTQRAGADVWAFSSLTGLYRSSDDGRTWSVRSPTCGQVSALGVAASIFIRCSSVHRSINDGVDFDPVGADNASSFAFLDEDIMYLAGSDGVKKSINGGADWENTVYTASSDVIVIDDAGAVFVRGVDGTVSVTTNGATDFNSAMGDLPGGTTVSVLRASARVWITTAEGALYVSSNQGTNWTEALLPDGDTASFLALDPSNSDRLWVIGATGILWISEDGGENFEGLDIVPTLDINDFFADDTGALYLGGHGVWVSATGGR